MNETQNDATTPEISRLGGIITALVVIIGTALIAYVGLRIVMGQDDDADSSTTAAGTSSALREWQAYDFTLESADGEMVSLSDFAGRPVVLNFWATWCVPCKREFPAFQQFMAEQGEDGAVVIAVNQGESLEAVQKFMDEVNVENLIVLLDVDLELAEHYPQLRMGLPVTYGIDAGGRVQLWRIGEMKRAHLDEFLADLG